MAAASGSPAQALPQLPPDFFDKPGRGGSSGSTAAPAAELPADFFEKPGGAGAKAKPASAFQQFKQGVTESLHPQSGPNAGMAERFVNSTVSNFGDAASALAHGHPLDAAGDLLAGYSKAYVPEALAGAGAAGAALVRGSVRPALGLVAGAGTGIAVHKAATALGAPEWLAELASSAAGLAVGGKVGMTPEMQAKFKSTGFRGIIQRWVNGEPKQNEVLEFYKQQHGKLPTTPEEIMTAKAEAADFKKQVAVKLKAAREGPEPWKPNKPTAKPNTPKYPGPQPSGQGPGYKGVGMSGAPPPPEKAPAEPWKPNAVNPNILKRYGKYPGPQRSGEGTAYRRVGMTGPKYPEAAAEEAEATAETEGSEAPASAPKTIKEKIEAVRSSQKGARLKAATGEQTQTHSLTATEDELKALGKNQLAQRDQATARYARTLLEKGIEPEQIAQMTKPEMEKALGQKLGEPSVDPKTGLVKKNSRTHDLRASETAEWARRNIGEAKKSGWFGSRRGSLSLAPSIEAKIEAGRAGRAHGSKMTSLFESSDRGIERPPLPGETGTPGAPVPKVPGKLIGRTTGRELGVDKTPYKAGFGIYEVPIDKVIGTEDISGSPDKLRDAAEYMDKIKSGSPVPPLWGHVDESGNVSIQGARRLLAAKRAGLKTVPVAIGQDYLNTER